MKYIAMFYNLSNRVLRSGGILIVFFVITAASSGQHKYIKYYEHLNYDTDKLHKQHNRAKRSSNFAHQVVSLQFQAHGRNFNLRLLPDDTIFHPEFQLEDGHGNIIEHDVSHVYHGTVYGQQASKVHGSIIDGVFRGVIKDNDAGTYYVDHINPFFGSDEKFHNRGIGHSVIYHENAIDYPYKYGSHETCGISNNMIEKQMKTVQDSKPKEEETLKRKKRALALDKNTCLLYISTDHVLFQEYNNREVIISKIAEHVKAITEIYGSTEFGNTQIRNIGFMVKRMTINETKGGADDVFANEYIGVEKFLEFASFKNHNPYCLAYVFTNRDFDNGVLGLAWVGSPQGSNGGICDKYTTFQDGRGKSLNTGIITFKNFGSQVPSKVSHITFAHEVGHNFGSPHDSGVECAPGSSSNLPNFFDDEGNYIMYARATSGNKPNNRVFSKCSIGNMTKVLEAKKDQCFVESDRPICGNGIIDKDEECDCGFTHECENLQDSGCCYSADDGENGCKLKPNKQCSVSQGPCCLPGECSFRGTDHICSNKSDCRHQQSCDGLVAECLTADPNPNKTECNHGTQVCWNGECTGSICEAKGLRQCMCVAPEGEEKTSNMPCRTCCEDPNEASPRQCQSTDVWSFWNKTIFLQPGSPCENYEGYCDVFSKCRKVDAEGPLSILKTAVLNPELYNTIRSWIVKYWWAVLLMVVASMILGLGFIKLCSVHTPSNNPRLPKHRELPGAGTLRRRRNQHQGNRSQQRQSVEMQYRRQHR